MREEVWYPLAGFAVLSWLVLGTAAVLHVKGKAQGHVSWVLAVFAALLSLTSGLYATRTWIADLIGWVIHLHPVILLFAAIIFMVVLWQLILGLAHDKLISFALTPALVGAAFLVPILAQQAAPAGKVGDQARAVVARISEFNTELTAGWFTGARGGDR